MTFKSMEELKNHILSQSRVAVRATQEIVFQIIDAFLWRFYKEYEPSMYLRTSQLMKSLVKTDVKLIGNSWVAEVYFDLSALDYSINTVKGQPREKKENWDKTDDAWVLETAMIGDYPHGGYSGVIGGTQIWVKSMYNLSKEGIETLKEELIKAGIPIR